MLIPADTLNNLKAKALSDFWLQPLPFRKGALTLGLLRCH